MFKYIIPILTLAVSAAIADPNVVTFSIANASTNAAAIAADKAESPTVLRGWIDSIVVDGTFAAANTCTVSVATSGSGGTGAARTIFSIATFSADATYFPRIPAQNTAGITDDNADTCKIPVFGDKITVSAYAKGSTNALAVKAYVVISPVP